MGFGFAEDSGETAEHLQVCGNGGVIKRHDGSLRVVDGGC
jgi:hypothetical protein